VKPIPRIKDRDSSYSFERRVSAVATLLGKKLIHNLLSKTEIRASEALESAGQIDKMPLRGATQSAQRSGDLKSCRASGYHALFLIHLKQIGMELKGEGDHGLLATVKHFQRTDWR